MSRGVPLDASLCGESEETMASEPAMRPAAALERMATQRDPQAWAVIIGTFGARMLQMAQRITRDPSLCDDICQEALLQIRAHAGSFRRPPPPRDADVSAGGWIMRITCCTAFKFLKLRARAARHEALAAEQTPQASIEHAGADRLLTQEELDLLRREVALLPETLRLPICLRFYGGMEYDEVAAALCCSSDAAKKRVQRGIDQLRSRLARAGVAIGLVALAAHLASGSVQAAEIAGAASTAVGTAAPIVLDAQRQAAWQALLHSSATPALSGVVMGGFVIMAKKIAIGVAALLMLGVITAQTVQSRRLSAELDQARAIAQNNQTEITAQKQKIAATMGDLAALQTQAEIQHKELADLRKKAAEQPAPSSTQAFTINLDNNDLAKPGVNTKVIELPGGGVGHVITLPAINVDLGANGAVDLRKALEDAKNNQPKDARQTTDAARKEADKAREAALEALKTLQPKAGNVFTMQPEVKVDANGNIVIKNIGGQEMKIPAGGGAANKNIDLPNGVKIQINGIAVQQGETQPVKPPAPPEKTGEF